MWNMYAQSTVRFTAGSSNSSAREGRAESGGYTMSRKIAVAYSTLSGSMCGKSCRDEFITNDAWICRWTCESFNTPRDSIDSTIGVLNVKKCDAGPLPPSGSFTQSLVARQSRRGGPERLVLHDFGEQ